MKKVNVTFQNPNWGVHETYMNGDHIMCPRCETLIKIMYDPPEALKIPSVHQHCPTCCVSFSVNSSL